MPRYRVTLRSTSVEIVTADNRYQAAVLACGRGGDGVEIVDVRPAVGRAAGTSTTRSTARTTKKAGKKVVKKRRPMSAQARARLAQNLVKARAARARNLKAAKKATKKSRAKKSVNKSPAKKSVKKAVKSR